MRKNITVPKSRIAVLIGHHGETKKRIEEEFLCRITIDSETGAVEIEGEIDPNSPLHLLRAGTVVQAIARGFSPDNAMKLKLDHIYLEILTLRDWGGNSDRALHRLRSRLIGKEGKSREMVEQYTNTNISVQGHTVGIIGEFQTLQFAKEAVIQILEGISHGNVFHFLEEKRRELKRMQAQIWQEKDKEEDKDFLWDASKSTIDEYAKKQEDSPGKESE